MQTGDAYIATMANWQWQFEHYAYFWTINTTRKIIDRKQPR